MKKRYYNYCKLDSYGAPLRVIVGGRRLGKTFGARRKVFEQFIDKGYRFVWIVENTILQQRLQTNNGELFFNNIKRYYKKNKTKTNERYLSVLENVQVDEDIVVNKSSVVVRAGAIKIKGETAGYLIALSDFAKAKGNDFGDIKYFIADEFIPEVLDKRSRDNVKKMVSIIESVIREQKATVYMFSNTTNITDELAMKLGIHKQRIGTYRKIFDEFGLLGVVHYVDEKEYQLHKEEVDKSTSGRIAKLFGEDRLYKNKFKETTINIVPEKKGRTNRMYLVQLEGKVYEVSKADNGGFYIQQVVGTAARVIYNNFIYGALNIKPLVKKLVSTQKVYYDCHATAYVFYDKLGLDVR